jgi:hypothetical protein
VAYLGIGYPIDAINATLQHTLHFLTLLTYYLGIKLPFEVSWTGAVPGVGQPSIAAGKGGENGGWAAWTEPYPLHLEKEAQSLVKDMVEAVGSSLGQNVGSASGTSSPNRQGSGLPSPGANNDRNRQLSNESDKSKGDGDQTATFTTGFAMLLYNVAYLAHTQGVDVALSQSGEVLRNLWAVCCSLELGKCVLPFLRSLTSNNMLIGEVTPPPIPPSYSHLRPVLLSRLPVTPPYQAERMRIRAQAHLRSILHSCCKPSLRSLQRARRADMGGVQSKVERRR